MHFSSKDAESTSDKRHFVTDTMFLYFFVCLQKTLCENLKPPKRRHSEMKKNSPALPFELQYYKRNLCVFASPIGLGRESQRKDTQKQRKTFQNIVETIGFCTFPFFSKREKRYWLSPQSEQTNISLDENAMCYDFWSIQHLEPEIHRIPPKQGSGIKVFQNAFFFIGIPNLDPKKH